MDSYRKIWKGRYSRILRHRQQLWENLTQFNEDEFKKRPKENLWSIDEILRHILGSEIRYIHQSFDPNRSQTDLSVRAQWVRNVFFRIEERVHYSLEEIKEKFLVTEDFSEHILEAEDSSYEKDTKAPWGEKMKIFQLLEEWYDHDNYHRGQIYYLINLYSKPSFT
ncbi:DinB family protein [Candidatus Hodarchaeum mangrovi]